MNSFFETINIFSSCWLDGMWTVIWQSIALAVIILLLTLCLKHLSAAARFWLWMLIPLRLLIMPLITISFPLLPAATPLESIEIEAASVQISTVESSELIKVRTDSFAEIPELTLAPVENLNLAHRRTWPNICTVLMLGWLAGIIFWWFKLAMGIYRIRRIIGDSADVGDKKVYEMAQKASAMVGLRQAPAILVTREKVSPFLFGVLCHVLVIPVGLINKVREDALFAVLVHEFAHLKRKDPLIGWILAVCETFYFFHPAFYFAKKQILFERERVCDDWAVATSKAKPSVYANALLSAAEICRTFSSRIYPAGVVAESFSDLKKRFIAIGSNLKPKARLSIYALILLFVVSAICIPGIALTARPTVKIEEKTKQTGESSIPRTGIESFKSEHGQPSSQAWHILRQWNTSPLLLGLTQRLGKAIVPSRRNESIWKGVSNGGKLRLNIAVENNTKGEIFVGFFNDAKWSSEPIQIRSFTGSGQYTLENLPVGKYQIGAMIGIPPVAEALGVHRKWPEPVEIRADETVESQVLLSSEFQKHASGFYNRQVANDYIGKWEDMNPGNLLQGQVKALNGQVIPFAKIMIREYNPGARGIVAPDRGTNEEGYFYYDDMEWPYRVIAVWRESLPSVFGYRFQQLFLNRVLEGNQTLNFQFQPFPAGTAVLTGQAVDQLEKPITEFFIKLGTWGDWNQKWQNPDGKYHSVIGYNIPFISKDGTFKISGLPAGVFKVQVLPFNIQSYKITGGEEIVLEEGKTTERNLNVVAKDLLYGRVLFEDGTVPKPEKISLVISMVGSPIGERIRDFDNDGYFAVRLSKSEIEQLRAGTSTIRINVRGKTGSKPQKTFPFKLLSSEHEKAGLVKIERPEIKPLSSTKLIPPKANSTDEVYIKPFNLLSTSGRTHSLSDYKGKVALINVCTTWCGPCKMELPHLKALYKKYAEQGLIILKISREEKPEVVELYTKRERLPFPVLVDPTGEVTKRFADKGSTVPVPTNILLDRQHRMITKTIGFNEEKFAKLKAAIDDAIKND